MSLLFGSQCKLVSVGGQIIAKINFLHTHTDKGVYLNIGYAVTSQYCCHSFKKVNPLCYKGLTPSKKRVADGHC